MADVFEVLTASESEQSIAKKAAADTLNAAIYDVRERFGEHLFIAKSKDEFHDRLALCKDDMMKTVNAHLMPVTGVMRRVCKTMEREWRERYAATERTAGDSVEVKDIPSCDICKYEHGKDGVPAEVDGKTKMGPWANMCADHFRSHGVGLGTGKGQQLRKRADATGPVQSLDQTYSPSDGPLIPSGDFAAYQNSVDQNAPAVVSGDFTSGGDSGKTAAPKRKKYRDMSWNDFMEQVAEPELRKGVEEIERLRKERGEVGDSGKEARRRHADGILSPGFTQPNNGGHEEAATDTPPPAGWTYPGQPKPTALNPWNDMPGFGNTARRRHAVGEMTDPGSMGGGMVTPPPAPGGMDPSTGGGAGVIPAPPGTGGSGPEVMTASIIKRYAQWCVANLARPSVQTLEYYAANRPDLDYFVLTAAVSNRRTAAGKGKDYLSQADEAITNLLNEKAEEFQESIQPLQQALQTIQYAEQVQQAQNPMGVMPPAGTVNVLPQTQGPAGPAPAGVDPASGQVDPAMLAQLLGQGGGDPSQIPQDPNAGIPPAAAEQGAVPPEMQMQARRRFARLHQAKNCTCWEGYKRVPGTKPCAKGSCEKCDTHSKNSRRRQAKGKKSDDQDYGADFDRQFGGQEEGGWRDSLDNMIDSVKLRDRSKESRRRYASSTSDLIA